MSDFNPYEKTDELAAAHLRHESGAWGAEQVIPEKPKRKVIQLAPVDKALYALCDDGTIWLLIRGADVWRELVTP